MAARLAKALQSSSDDHIASAIQEIIVLPVNQAVKLLEKALDSPSTVALLVDALWYASCTSPESIEPLLKALAESQADNDLLAEQLLAQIDADLLAKTSWTPDAKDLSKKVRLFNTTTFYKQQKYNLLAEESEGYAKFMAMLNAKDQASPTLITNLIGTFKLDPNRCVDLAVDAVVEDFRSGPTVVFGTLPLEHLPKLLAFKLEQTLHQPKILSAMVWFVKQGWLSIAAMLEYLEPAPIDSIFDQVMKSERDRVRGIGRVRLISSPADDQAKLEGQVAARKSALDELAANLAIRWIKVFLEAGQWSLVEPVFADQWSMLCQLYPTSVGRCVCSAAEALIEPLYDRRPPWQESTAMETDQSLTHILPALVKTLQYTFESGCVRHHPVLFSKLCRVLAKTELTDAVLDLKRDYVLPSLSLFSANAVASEEVWAAVERLPYQTRYALYRSWRGSGLERDALRSNKPLWLVEGELEAGKVARYALKRLSKDTIRDSSRALAKVCHSHPLVVFGTILSQIESYDNLVDVMVDALRYCTPLSLDVLSSCILGRLSGSTGGANRSRLKPDGVNLSQWLQSLESFSGAVYKQFPDIEFQGILFYLMHRLKSGQVMEIGMLRTLLKTSAGWAFADYAPAASLSASQLDGRSGSSLLKRETMSFGIVEGINLRASQAVRKVLQSGDMGVSLLILLAQVRHQIVFADSSSSQSIKLIANLVDTCQVVMAILLDFLTDPADDHEDEQKRVTDAIAVYAKSMPSLVDLLKVYGLDVATAWMMCRPLIRAAAADASGPLELERFRPDKDSHEAYREMIPSSAWQHIGTGLFEAFFSYSLYDILCPEETYATEIARLEKTAERLAQQKVSSPPVSTVQPGPVATKKTEEEELERTNRTVARLKTDLAKQKKHVDSCRGVLKSKRVSFYPSKVATKEGALTLLSRCIYPRCMLSPDDALYCARFIAFLHEEEVPGFGTLQLFDVLIIALSRALFGMTEGEAANVSILLSEIWKTVSRWRYGEGVFDEEVAGTPGAMMIDESGEAKSITFKQYEELYNKWHAAVGNVALGCLKSSEYIHARNCLIVLTRMVEVFPTRPRLALTLLKALEPLQEESSRLTEVRASAQAYGTQLLRARDEGVWKEESEAAVQARQRKEQEVAAARQEQAKKAMEEIKRDSEKITEEIGEWDGRRGDRDRRPRDGGIGGRRSGGLAFEPPPGRASDDRRGPPPPDDRRGPTVPPPPARDGPRSDDRWVRDRGPTVGRAPPSDRDRREDRSREASPPPRGGSKRSRPPSPVEDGEAHADPPTKRARNESTGGKDDAGETSGGKRRRGGRKNR